jgi:hypothetical protein
MNIEPLKEGVKEGVRLLMIAVLPVVISQLGQGSIDYKAIAIIGIIAILRGVEKYFYELGKETGDMNKVSRILELR